MMTKLRQQHVHSVVAATAMQAANELYDTLMGDNMIYTEWKRQNADLDHRSGPGIAALRKRFVLRNWGKCVPVARATLARILATSNDEVLKETVHEALCFDNTLVRGRGKAFTPVFE